MAMQTQLGSVRGRVANDDDAQGRSRLRFGSVPPNVKFIDNKPVYVVMHSDREYGGAVKPAVYDPYYGVNYVPSNGRDSWSAYHISDAALDDNDELVLKSRERDSHFLKEINKKLGSILNAPPPQSPAKYKATPRTVKVPAFGIPPKPPRVPATPEQQRRRQPPPASVKAAPTVGEDYFKAKLFERAPDLRDLSDVSTLRSQLRDTSGLLDKQRLMLDRYRTDREAGEFLDLRRRACSPARSVTGVPVGYGRGSSPARRFERATSLQPESARQKLSPVRSHIRDVLERTRKK